MRTTLELPEEILRQAKIAAVQRGTTLRELVRQALVRELGIPKQTSDERKRATFPIFGSVLPGSLDLTKADLSTLEILEDRRRHGRST